VHSQKRRNDSHKDDFIDEIAFLAQILIDADTGPEADAQRSLRDPCESLFGVEIGFARPVKAILTKKSRLHGLFKRFFRGNRVYTACFSDFDVEIGFAPLV